MRSIRVLVVDDSALMRRLITDVLGEVPRVEVVGVAKDGAQAVRLNHELQPDVVTLDIQMPEMTGLEALPLIIEGSAARVVMLSSVDDPDTTYAALEAGAVDFVPKPGGRVAASREALAASLAEKIEVAYRVSPSRRVSPGPAPARRRRVPVPGAKRDSAARAVGIAASTGGPPALERVMSGLVADLPAAYLVVQHLPAGFTASLARRLSAVTDLEVKEAEDGELVRRGVAYLAPSGAHMTVGGSARPRIVLQDSRPLHGVRPAADPLFESLARVYGDRSIGVVLSGMGVDGADGMAAIRRAGGVTIVQDEDTSVVWGMPGTAVRAGVVDHVLPVHLVAREVRGVVKEGVA